MAHELVRSTSKSDRSRNAMTIEWTDRYGGVRPDPTTFCRGPCEGIGTVPIFVAHSERIPASCEPIEDERDATLRARWLEAHHDAGVHECDGWHFVTCPVCEGSGKRPLGGEAA